MAGQGKKNPEFPAGQAGNSGYGWSVIWASGRRYWEGELESPAQPG